MCFREWMSALRPIFPPYRVSELAQAGRTPLFVGLNRSSPISVGVHLGVHCAKQNVSHLQSIICRVIGIPPS